MICTRDSFLDYLLQGDPFRTWKRGRSDRIDELKNKGQCPITSICHLLPSQPDARPSICIVTQNLSDSHPTKSMSKYLHCLSEFFQLSSFKVSSMSLPVVNFFPITKLCHLHSSVANLHTTKHQASTYHLVKPLEYIIILEEGIKVDQLSRARISWVWLSRDSKVTQSRWVSGWLVGWVGRWLSRWVASRKATNYFSAHPVLSEKVLSRLMFTLKVRYDNLAS